MRERGVLYDWGKRRVKRLEQRAKRYCRHVARALPFGGAKKRGYLAAIKQDVLRYLSEHPWDGEEKLREVFGSPEQIAAAFVSEMPYEEINNRFRARNRALFIVSVAVILALLLLVGMIVYLIIRNQQDMDGYFVVTSAVSGRRSLL